MKRRDFITLVGGAAVWPIAVRAQQAAVPVVGFVRSSAAASFGDLFAAFRAGLNEAGLVDSRNVSVEQHWADNRPDRLTALVAALVHREVAVIVGNSEAALAAKVATASIPIVFIVGTDPVSAGLVASLNRPGGNVTGVSFFDAPLAAKRLGLLRELLPRGAAVALLLDANFSEADVEKQELETAAKAMERRVTLVKIGAESELYTAFVAIAQSGASALLVGAGPFFNGHRRRIVALAARYAIPAIYVLRQFVEVGGLASYRLAWGKLAELACGLSSNSFHERLGTRTFEIVMIAHHNELDCAI